MTVRNDLDRGLGTYLEARATSRAPEGLLETTLGRIETTPQRPGWLVPERWFPSATTFWSSRSHRGAARFALVAVLLAILVAVAVVVGSQRRVTPPLSLGRPGLIVFASSAHLFTVHADGSGRKQLTFGSDSDYRPTWSPDGTLIAYLSSTVLGSDAIKVVSADGQTLVTILDHLAPSDSGHVTWSPDSRRVAFAAAADQPPLARSYIYVGDAVRGGATRLGGPELLGFEPSWSPDGKHIAFKNLQPVDALWLMDADGMDAHRLTTMAGSGSAFLDPQWSPDSSHLLFLAGDDGAHDVWTIKADGTDQQDVSKSAEDESPPTWSPDGSKIAFARISSVNYGSLVVVNADGSNAATLLGPRVDRYAPIWSPDGTKLFGFEMAGVVNVGIVVQDLSGRYPPTSIADVSDGAWQRLPPQACDDDRACPSSSGLP